MENKQAYEALKQGFDKLPLGDQAFALSLLGQFAGKGTLSDKQWVWVGKLAQALVQPPPPEPPAQQLGNFGTVIELFKLAGKTLKHPRIVLQLPDKQEIALALAGAGSKAPGTVAVTDNRPYGSNTYYGRVAPDGAWQPGKYATPATLTAVTALLAAFAKNPSGIAADYGHLVGRCAFCGSDPTDERSVSVGFGPVCAKRWGMAWGKKA